MIESSGLWVGSGGYIWLLIVKYFCGYQRSVNICVWNEILFKVILGHISRDIFKDSMFEAEAKAKAVSFHSSQAQGQWSENKLECKFKLAYFQCHNSYILFSVLTVNSLTPTATVTGDCYISKTQVGYGVFLQLSPVETRGQATLTEDALHWRRRGWNWKKPSPAMAAVYGLQIQPTAASW